MLIRELTDPEAVHAAIAEFHRLGRPSFLRRYGYGPARRYLIRSPDGRTYDSKAIAGVAYGYQFPERGPLKHTEFSGGEATVKAQLESLGFEVIEADTVESASETTNKPFVRVWVEKTIVKGRPDRQEGEHKLGAALWSPQRSSDGRDVYANMREVKPGDIVLHLTDNEGVAGYSTVADVADSTFTGVSGTDWGDKPGYRVQLRDFELLDPPLDRTWFLKEGAVGEKLKLIAKGPRGRGLFYNERLELNQGGYLTEAPATLVEVLNDVYNSQTGRSLPFMRDLTSSLDAPAVHPAITAFNVERLKAATRLFRWQYGDAGFESDKYKEDERRYKVNFVEQWQRQASPDRVAGAMGGSNETATLADELGKLLTGQKEGPLLPWRYAAVLKAPWSGDRAASFIKGVQLLQSTSNDTRPAIDEFNALMMPAYKELLDETVIKPASHTIPSLILWLSNPGAQFFVRPDWYNRAFNALTGAPPEGQGLIMSSQYYGQALAFAERVRSELLATGLPASDMVDIQSFLWAIFGRSRVWFCGHSYSRHVDMLPEFFRRGSYATNWALRPEVAALFEGTQSLGPEERKHRLGALERAATGTGERKTLLSLFDLATRPRSLILAKAVSFDRTAQQSLLRISAVGITGPTYTYDDALGHQLETSWTRIEAQTFVLRGSLFPKLNATINTVTTAEALDAISVPTSGASQLTPHPQVEVEGNEPIAEVLSADGRERVPFGRSRALEGLFMSEKRFERLLSVWRAKKNLILEGAPGVGKSFVARRLAYSLIGYEDPSRVGFVQFHQSYSYEDFVQGFRPNAYGQLSIKDGIFVDFCEQARDDPGEIYVFVIDEINRGNVSKIFGELLLLVEADKRSSKWGIKLAYGSDAVERFYVPENLYVLGLMNTADRSLAVVDYALRRRFAFMRLEPAYSEHSFKSHLISASVSAELTQRIVDRMTALNDAIAADSANLGSGFCIGHSFFVPGLDGIPPDESWLQDVIETEILPLLSEYWYDNEPRYKQWAEFLLKEA